MPQITIDSFMKYADFFYKSVGMEAYTRFSRPSVPSIWSNLIYWANIINLVVVLACEIAYVLIAFATGEHIVEAIMTMSYIGFVVVGMSKLMFVWWKKSALSTLFQELEQLYPCGEQQQQAYGLRQYLSTLLRLSFIYSALYTLLIWTYNLLGVGQYLIYDLWLHTRDIGPTLPYFVYIPWQWQGHWSYYVILVMENLGGYTSAVGQISTDLLLIAVATQIIMHFDYLARRIEQYMPNGDWAQDRRHLGDIISHHERLLRLSATLNDIFGLPLLFNFMISTFVICFVGFQIAVGAPDALIKLLLFMISSLSEVYLICYYGQLIVDASLGISKAAYKHNWISGEERYKRALIFLIARAQKPCYLTATIFIRITMGTMTDLLQLSYKFFALLRTMYVK